MLSPRYTLFGSVKRVWFPLALILFIFYVIIQHESLGAQVFKPIDITGQRKTFRNDVYSKLSKRKTGKHEPLLDRNCTDYFQAWNDLYFGNEMPLSKLDRIQNMDIDSNIYKKSKWMKKRALFYRTQKDKKTKEEINKLVERDFAITATELSKFEREFVDTISHQRVWGKCYLKNIDLGNNDADSLCENFIEQNFPWITKNLPSFTSWSGENNFPVFDDSQFRNTDTKCFFKKYLSMSNGRGIAITIFPEIDRKRQIENIGSLLKVLRKLKNTLPIEIIYMSEHWDKRDTEYLIKIATRPFSASVRSQEIKIDDEEFPLQNIIFVNLLPAINIKEPLIAQAYGSVNIQGMLLLGSIFNSFSEAIMMTYQTIPLAENLSQLIFENESYKENGILLFKKPSYYTSHTKYFGPGYYETQDLVLSHLMPSKIDHQYFNMTLRSGNLFQHTDRIFKENFNDLMDPNFFAFKKNQSLSGFLLSFNLQPFKILSTRFQLEESTNIDLFWVGQELSGNTEKLNFNNHYGVAAGLVTPVDNVPRNLVTYSQELCSSSWGQLSDADDKSLIYVTSHQLENAIFGDSEQFKEDLTKKYESSLTIDNFEDYKEILHNPLFIASVLNPPVITKPQTSGNSDEPSKSWIDQEKYEIQYHNKYYCGYNIVGGIESNYKTQIIYYNENDKNRFNSITKLWYIENN